MSGRDFDVVVFGATGFTGRLTAQYLARSAPEGVRWAIAGRSGEKLASVAAALPRKPERIVADVADEQSLRAMARSTRVLATTVGPYDLHGEPVVRACVEEGTEYCDITGEPQFVDRMLVRYHEQARAQDVRIVSCCGFDSVPHDLGVLFTLDHVPRGVPLSVEGFVSSRGTFSGGTWHSAIRAFGNVGEVRRARALAGPPRATDGRRVRALRASVHWEREIGGWACPLPTIDRDVVLRSAATSAEYGPDFAYGHYVRVRRLPTLLGGAAAVGGLFALAQLPPARSLLLKLKDPGEGPSEAQRARAWFRVTFVARAADRVVVTEVSGGDPGYTETSKMLAESALCLALDRHRTPGHRGVVTPAAAMGRALVERLERASIAFRHLRG